MLNERDFCVRLRVGDTGNKNRGKKNDRSSLGTSLKKSGDSIVTD